MIEKILVTSDTFGMSMAEATTRLEHDDDQKLAEHRRAHREV